MTTKLEELQQLHKKQLELISARTELDLQIAKLRGELLAPFIASLPWQSHDSTRFYLPRLTKEQEKKLSQIWPHMDHDETALDEYTFLQADDWEYYLSFCSDESATKFMGSNPAFRKARIEDLNDSISRNKVDLQRLETVIKVQEEELAKLKS